MKPAEVSSPAEDPAAEAATEGAAAQVTDVVDSGT